MNYSVELLDNFIGCKVGKTSARVVASAKKDEVIDELTNNIGVLIRNEKLNKWALVTDNLCRQCDDDINITELNNSGLFTINVNDLSKHCAERNFINLTSRASYWRYRDYQLFTDNSKSYTKYEINSLIRFIESLYSNVLNVKANVYYWHSGRGTSNTSPYMDWTQVYVDKAHKTKFIEAFFINKKMEDLAKKQSQYSPPTYQYDLDNYLTDNVDDYHCTYYLVFNLRKFKSHKRYTKITYEICNTINTLAFEDRYSYNGLTYILSEQFPLNMMYQDVINEYFPTFCNSLEKFNKQQYNKLSKLWEETKELGKSDELFAFTIYAQSSNIQITDIRAHDLSTIKAESSLTNKDLIRKLNTTLEHDDLYQNGCLYINKHALEPIVDKITFSLTEESYRGIQLNIRRGAYVYRICADKCILEYFKDIIGEDNYNALICEYVLRGGDMSK